MEPEFVPFERSETHGAAGHDFPGVPQSVLESSILSSEAGSSSSREARFPVLQRNVASSAS